MAAVTELASAVGASAACQALGLPRASYYRVRRKTSFPEETVVIAFSGHGTETHELVGHDTDPYDLARTTTSEGFSRHQSTLL